MKISMKKRIFMLMMVVTSATFAFGQSAGDVALGGNVAYTSRDHYSSLGLGVKLQWNVTDAIRLEPSTTLFTKDKGVSLWDVSFNGHYLFNVANNFYLYPIGGISLTGASYDGANDSDTQIGFNAGGGAEYAITPKLSVNAEIKYLISDKDWDRSLFTTGIVYRF